MTPEDFARACAGHRHPVAHDAPPSADNPGGRLTWCKIAAGSYARASKEGRLTMSHALDAETAAALAIAAEAKVDAAEMATALLRVAGTCLQWIQEIDREAGQARMVEAMRETAVEK